MQNSRFKFPYSEHSYIKTMAQSYKHTHAHPLPPSFLHTHIRKRRSWEHGLFVRINEITRILCSSSTPRYNATKYVYAMFYFYFHFILCTSWNFCMWNDWFCSKRNTHQSVWCEKAHRNAIVCTTTVYIWQIDDHQLFIRWILRWKIHIHTRMAHAVPSTNDKIQIFDLQYGSYSIVRKTSTAIYTQHTLHTFAQMKVSTKKQTFFSYLNTFSFLAFIIVSIDVL